MFIKRTDLALEARELWQESAERTTRLMGVKATKSKLEGYPVTRVDILDHRGEELTVVLPQRIGCCTLRKMTKPQLLGLLRAGL